MTVRSCKEKGLALFMDIQHLDHEGSNYRLVTFTTMKAITLHCK